MGLKDDKGKPLPIDAKSNVAALTKFILSATEEIDPGSDEFAPETLAILSHVGYTGFDSGEELIPEEIVKPPAAPVMKSKPADDLAEDGDWKEPEPTEPLTLQQQVAAAKRLADLKDLVTGNLEFKKLVPKLKSYMGLAGPRMLKAEMQKIVGAPEVAMKPVKEKKTGEKKGPRGNPADSNKGRIYLAWKAGEADVKKLHTVVTGAVKENTIKVWITMWSKSKNLPAVASI
jgi:hypothetical protein